MDTLETPYDEEAEFIECTVCNKSIRGDALYKIHLTTPGHIKSQVFHRYRIKLVAGHKEYPKVMFHYTKEDLVLADGTAVRQHNIPVFKDIEQYLDYLKLDEPIIGLNYLDEVPCNDPQAGLKYICKLCRQTANLREMVHHVIGRKHRQKYVEVERPDLVTWDKQSIMTQVGKIIRARAEIIERQDGRGTSTRMPKKEIEGRLNMSRVPPRQRQNGDRDISQTQRDVPSHLTPLMDYQDEYSHRGRYPQGHLHTPPLHPEDQYMLNQERQMHQREDSLRHDRMAEELQRADYRQSNTYRQDYKDPDYRREYEEEYGEGPQRAVLKPSGVPKYDSRAEIPRGLAQREEYYPENAPQPDRRPYPQRDPLMEFYSEEVRRGQVRSAELQRSQAVRPEGDNRQWSQDRESGRLSGLNSAGRQGSNEPEPKRRNFPTPVESDRSHDHLFNKIIDYCHESRQPHQEETFTNPRPHRTGPLNSQRKLEATGVISDIPEPFRRFLKGAASDEGQGKRKRKSRFSDATAEEMETTREMFSDELGPSNPKFGSGHRRVSAPLRPEIHGTQHPDHYTESQAPHHTENYQRGGSESTGVFDMLKNIEIENAEDANFLKNKLCNLLKEFKAKKSEKQNSHSRVVLSKDYTSLKLDPELSPRHQYETVRREDSDLRRSEEPYFEEDNRGRGWKQHERTPDQRLQEYQHPVHGELGHPNSNRSRYKEVFGSPAVSLPPRTTHPDEPARYPERFQEPLHPRDYRPASEEFFDSHSSAPPLHMERGPRMDMGPRYSGNLDKITSTLLELVARK